MHETMPLQQSECNINCGWKFVFNLARVLVCDMHKSILNKIATRFQVLRWILNILHGIMVLQYTKVMPDF